MLLAMDSFFWGNVHLVLTNSVSRNGRSPMHAFLTFTKKVNVVTRTIASICGIAIVMFFNGCGPSLRTLAHDGDVERIEKRIVGADLSDEDVNDVFWYCIVTERYRAAKVLALERQRQGRGEQWITDYDGVDRSARLSAPLVAYFERPSSAGVNLGDGTLVTSTLHNPKSKLSACIHRSNQSCFDSVVYNGRSYRCESMGQRFDTISDVHFTKDGNFLCYRAYRKNTAKGGSITILYSEEGKRRSITLPGEEREHVVGPIYVAIWIGSKD
jgi:hypothetical protein